jgi:hypothetical protein
MATFSSTPKFHSPMMPTLRASRRVGRDPVARWRASSRKPCSPNHLSAWWGRPSDARVRSAEFCEHGGCEIWTGPDIPSRESLGEALCCDSCASDEAAGSHHSPRDIVTGGEPSSFINQDISSAALQANSGGHRVTTLLNRLYELQVS